MTTSGLPPRVAPMLASPGPLPAGDGWHYEIKWDGARLVLQAAGDVVLARTRTGRDVTRGFPELIEAARLLRGRRAVLDGELVAPAPGTGWPSFPRLQQRIPVAAPGPALLASTPVRFLVFDILHLDGQPTIDRPYHQRRALLDQLALHGDIVQTPPVFHDREHALAFARSHNLEGVVAKRADSRYLPGRRTASWRKHVFTTTCDVLIVGFRPGNGRRAGRIGALLLATEQPDGRLHYAGSVGSGLSHSELDHLAHVLGPLRRATAAVADVPRADAAAAVWVEPAVTAEVTCRQTTGEGRLRHPVWRGIRTDLTSAAPPPVRSMRRAPAARVVGAMSTPDGVWRVEVIRHAQRERCRLVHGRNVVDDLDMAQALRLLAVAGVDVGSLREASTTAA